MDWDDYLDESQASEFDDGADSIDVDPESELYSSPAPYSSSRVSHSPSVSDADSALEDDFELEGGALASDYGDDVDVAYGIYDHEDEEIIDDEDEHEFEYVFEGESHAGDGHSDGRRSEGLRDSPADSLFVNQGVEALPPLGSLFALDYNNWEQELGNRIQNRIQEQLRRPTPLQQAWDNHRQHSRHRSARERASAADMDELVEMEVRPARAARRRSRTPARASAQAEVIDLTGEPDSPEQPRAAAPARSRNSNADHNSNRNSRRQASLNQRTPSLPRSDGSLLGGNHHEIVIDLTLDDAPPPPRMPEAPPRRHHHRPHNPPPPPPRRQRVDLSEADFSTVYRFVTHMASRPLDFVHRLGGVFGNHQPIDVDVQIIGGGRAQQANNNNNNNNLNNPLAENVPNLNYHVGGHHHHGHGGGGAGGGGGGSRKPAHVPPPPARPGFTRNTGTGAGSEDEVAVCPSCEQELQYDPEEEDSVNGPPAKKARTRKDREEHHFWAVKECGHVYCKDCYEGRKGGKNSSANFRKGLDSVRRGQILCAVEGCRSDVSNKPAWVGLFL
ncbi:hypothetical protein N656DRAFT_771429 [Canariomyces notabilis]|uniref:Cell cycle control protein n=1 Tax=Canariomyces notabilis TaxID=2074819 RepID=A0AAN6QEX3_9PEZI|nr:hypothetical protein N656DRAFT_771429 [Canariomyces arenarius]